MEIRILGPVSLALNERRVELGSDKERTLLALLALDVGRPVPLETLLEGLWDGEPPQHPRENLRTYISRIRRHIRLTHPGPDAPHITHRARTYTLEAEPLSVDWGRFQKLQADSGNASARGDDEQAAFLLHRAEELWQGEALSGLAGAWIGTVRRSLEERRLSATVSRISADLRLGRFAELVGELSALVDKNPGDESLTGRLVLAYYGSGRYTDAIRIYQRTRQILTTEYGSPVGADLSRIHQGVIDRIPPLELAHTTTTSAIKSPESAVVRGKSPLPPADSASSRPSSPPTNLPYQPPIIGRKSELHALSMALKANPREGMVIALETVSGMAGVGKTAVAVHTARQLAPRFPDGQLYVNFGAHSLLQEPLSAESALATLLRLLGTPPDYIPTQLEELSALWRTMMADRRAVVVLDDVSDATQVIPLLAGDSRSLIIATSRSHLTELPHAHSIPMDVLPADDAIALFRRSAGEHRTQDIEETDRIVRLCGYLPLAIEIVASRFRIRPSWTLATLANRLDHIPGRLGEFWHAGRDLLRAFELSYQTLRVEERRTFRLLSLHPGSDFTAEAAAALLQLALPATERLLESLLACHLLREPTPERFQYHDLLREYAFILATSEDEEEQRVQALSRLIKFYSLAADRADTLAYPRRLRSAPGDSDATVHLPVVTDAAAAKSWFASEHMNLLAVEKHARSQGRSRQSARISYAMTGFLEGECHWNHIKTVIEPAITHWDDEGSQSTLCYALIHLSTAHANTGCYQEAAEAGRRALEIARTTGDAAGEAAALRAVGTLNWHLGEHNTALKLLQECFAISTKSGDPWEIARGDNNIAVTLLFLGKYEESLSRFERALAGFTETEDGASIGKTLNNVGDLYLRAGRTERARQSFEKALATLQVHGNRYDQATVRVNLAAVLTKYGDIEAALPLYHEALSEFHGLADKQSQSEVLIGIGELHERQGDNEKAVTYHSEALGIARAIGAAPQEGQALRHLGQSEAARGRLDAAISHLRAAVAVADRTQDRDEAMKARDSLTNALRASADTTRRDTKHQSR